LRRRGAVIVEFALVVPFLALIVFGVIDFSRAYGQVNALDSALREGARFGAKLSSFTVGDYVTDVKVKVAEYASVYGFSGLDTSLVSVSANPSASNATSITVTVTNHPIPLEVLGRFLGVPPLTVSRTLVYRWQCAGLAPGTCK
jgi:Flp pilus assembly protein TadG